MNIYTENTQNSLVGLNDYVGLAYADWAGDIGLVWDYFKGKYKKEWLDAVQVVCDEINYNEGKKKWINYTVVPGAYIEGFEYEKFFNVLNAYGNVVTQITKAQFDDSKGDAYNNYTLNETKNATGYPLELVQRILKQFYWDTVQGRIPSDKWLNPITYATYDEQRKPRPDIVGTDWLDSILTWAKWIAIFLGVAVATYFIFQVFSIYKETKN